MKEEYQSLFEKLLFALPDTAPPLKTYAIVDSARDSDFKEKVMLSALPYASLWHETWFELEQERPLYLVEPKRGGDLLRQLIKSRDKSIATYFISPCNIETLQAYYSRFTYVEIEERPGEYEKAIFGFYDPNVLPNYIKTLYSEEKIEEFFAGAAVWLAPSAENEDGVYIAYRSKSGAIADINLRLKHFIEEESPMLDFDDVRVPAATNLDAYAHEVCIDNTQMKIFDTLQKERFAKEALNRYISQGYEEIETTRPWIEKAAALLSRGGKDGIGDEGVLEHYILLGLLLKQPMHSYGFYKHLLRLPTQEERREYIQRLLWQMEKERSRHDKQ